MDTANKFALGTLLSIGLFGAINLLGTTVFAGAKLDLTEDRLYTLSDGAKAIAADLDETIRLELYASQDMRKSDPRIGDFMQRVEDVLEGFVEAADGRLVLERFDPQEYSEAEDEAALNGLQRIRMGETATGYFGLVMRNSVGDKETIRYFNPADEVFLEYEIAERLVSLDAARKPVLGLMTGLPLNGGEPAAPGQRPQPAWRITDMLARTFDVRMLEPARTTAIADDVDVLLIVHPHDYSDATLYAIDQFALAGGRVVALLDPFCAVDEQAQRQGGLPSPSDLGPLLDAWGVAFAADELVGDRRLARSPTQPPGLLSMWVTNEQVDQEDPVTARLSDVQLFTPGALSPVEGATTTFDALLTTTDEAGPVDRSSISAPERILENFVPRFEPYTLVARVTGPIETAFPEGPGSNDDESGDSGAEDDGSTDAAGADALPEGHLAASEGDFQAILVADADLIYDGLWLQRTVFGDSKFAENADLVMNAVEQLAGSDALLSLRARGTFERPFEVVQGLRLAADEELAAEEQRLTRELDQINARIQEIAQEQGGGSSVLLTPELEEELDKAYAKRDETRKELRRVKFDLKRDEEALGRRVKAINILGMPLVVIIGGILVWMRRRSRAVGAD